MRNVCIGSIAVIAAFALGGSVASAERPSQTPDPVVRQQMQKGADDMSARRFSEAVADYTAVTRALPHFAEGYLNLGLALEQDSQFAAASVALRKSLLLKPDLRGANLFLGLIAYRQNHFKDAEAGLLKETRIDPHDAKAFMWLGVCYLAEDKPEAAIQPLNRAYSLDPTDADILYHRGHTYLLMANASYAAMFRLNHDSMRVHQVLGEAYAAGYRTQQAIPEFEIAIRKAPHQPGLHQELADQYWIAGQLEKAAAAYRQELVIDPYSAVTMYKLGSLLVLNNKPAAGVELLRSALHADPSLNDAHYYLGNGLMVLGQAGEAIREYKAAIAVDPTDSRAMRSWYKLSLAYRNNGDEQAARAAMAEFLKMRRSSEANQDRNTAEIVKSRMSLPVADPDGDSLLGAEQAATSTGH